MKRRLRTGTILKIIPAKDNASVVTHVVVITTQGKYKAVLGPGMYKIIKVAELSIRDKVLISMEPVPTMMGRICDE